MEKFKNFAFSEFFGQIWANIAYDRGGGHWTGWGYAISVSVCNVPLPKQPILNHQKVHFLYFLIILKHMVLTNDLNVIFLGKKLKHKLALLS